MAKNQTNRVLWVVVVVLICAMLFQTVAASTLSDSFRPILNTDKPIDLNELLKDLSGANEELRRVTRDVAVAQEKEPLLADRVERLGRKIAEADTWLETTRAALLTSKRKKNEFDNSLGLRMSQIRADLANFESSQKELQSQRNRDIEGARKQREDLRTKLGAMPGGQDEVIRERQLKRQAVKETQQRIDSTSVAAYQRLESERRYLEQQVQTVEEQVAMAEKEQERVRGELDSTLMELAVARSTITYGAENIDSLRSEIAYMDDLRQRVPVPVLETSRNQLVASSNADSGTSWWPSSTFASRSSLGTGSQAVPLGSVPLPKPKYSQNGFDSLRFNPNYRPPVGNHRVGSYTRRNGTYVQSHQRTDKDSSFWNNFSSKGNVNPFTGKKGSHLPRAM